ncbi:hypothetical protein E3P99_01649 [Wallemia hederae]|uniref:Proteasome assembly chaperone 1 n=1 Tax=Wallemia hederae TaxID=1540922 RepID=A0A4T0FPZ6_9BASI|nr:hypothetical protein E3P99_01649 [Wallemia hederae]
MERDPLGQNRPFRHQIDSDEEDEDMQGVYPGQEVKPAPPINIDVHLKNAVDAVLHNQPLLVAIGWVGRHYVFLLDNADVSAVNEVVADGQTVALLLRYTHQANTANILYVPSQPVLELTHKLCTATLASLNPSSILTLDAYPNTTIYLQEPYTDSENPPLLQLANVTEERVQGVDVLPPANIVEGLSAAFLSTTLVSEKATPAVALLVPTLAPYTPIVSHRLANSVVVTQRQKSDDLDDFIEGHGMLHKVAASVQQKTGVSMSLDIQRSGSKSSKVDLISPFRRKRGTDNLMYL